MPSTEFLKAKFHAALPFDDYVATGKPNHRDAWVSFFERVSLTPAQTELIGGFQRKLYILISSGTWCGDCVQQCPIFRRFELANPEKVTLRMVDRDEHADLAEQIKLCGGLRVPVVMILNEDFDLLSMMGDRSLNRYRALAAKQLGAACPVPGAAVPDEEVASTVQDWAEELERAHLMARLSTKLRERHGD
ncbi:MAG: thioredoxin family protein [Phycisphaerales bacterium]|nr:thioredoxin family protein [Phycisphaerales bacterium]